MTSTQDSNQSKTVFTASHNLSAQPILETNPTSISASHYYQQALNAYSANQWHETCQLAQACITIANNDVMESVQAKNLYAAALLKLDMKEQALTLWREISEIFPNDAGLLVNIAMVLTKLHRMKESIGYFQRSVQIVPSYSSYVNLGFACHQCGEITLAKASYLQALNYDPKAIQARINLAEIFRNESSFEEAHQLFEQAFESDPENISILNAIVYLQQLRYPFNTKNQIQYSRRFGEKLELHQITGNKQIKLENHTPLRVGFVSADLYKHPVGFFLESTLEQLNVDSSRSGQLELIAYHNSSKQDEYTKRLKTCFGIWHQVDTWNDSRLIEQIKQDRIDILIDLSGHTGGNRLPVFARKAAPLQVSWLGYFGSTGLSNIDYILADPICVPTSEDYIFIEKIWRLPQLRYCFSIPKDAPEVSPSPCLYQQEIIFGCYQKLLKINQGVLQCWARILEACQHARIRIQIVELLQAEAKELFISRIKNFGIDLQRIDLVGGMTREEYLASYSEVDIILDTFPYTGGTTTVEALWMGVPTLTLALPSMLGRQGEALMENAGLSDWVAYSEDEYVQKAIDWACAVEHQRQELAVLRIGMREQVRHSPIFNANQFAQDFVDALYAMWDKKCAE